MSEEMQLELEHTLKTMRELKEAKAEIERLRAAMSDAEKAYQATPASTLEEQIMNPCIAKNEREWWAATEIERLRDEVERLGKKLNVARYGEPDFAWSIYEAQMVDLRATNERLRAALEPFANALKGNWSHQGDSMKIVAGPHANDLRLELTLYDFRRAALAEEKPHDR
jgi:hypothetical protein